MGKGASDGSRAEVSFEGRQIQMHSKWDTVYTYHTVLQQHVLYASISGISLDFSQ